MSFLRNQYRSVKESRLIMFEFCKEIHEKDFTNAIKDFGRGSIRDTLVHIANVYEFWIGKFSMKFNNQFTEKSSISNANEIYNLFSNIDLLVDSYIETYGNEIEYKMTGEIPWLQQQKEYTVLTIMTHVITHEFHHKGQIMTMGRMLGYKPPDTDVIHF